MYHSNKLLLVKTNLSVSSFFTLHNVFSANFFFFFDMQNSKRIQSIWLLIGWIGGICCACWKVRKDASFSPWRLIQ